MNIAVLGGGAVGTFLGERLAETGNDIAILSRNPEYCDVVNHDAWARALPSIPSLFNRTENFDLALFCVKSFSTESLVRELSPYFARIGHIVSLQNGLGNEEIILNTGCPPEKIVASSLTIACSMDDPGKARAENKGGIALAPTGNHLLPEFVPRIFGEAGIKIRICPDWKAMKWSKLLLNIMANATCAILDMSPYEVYSDSDSFLIERRLFLEALSVMESSGLHPVSLPSHPVPLYAWGFKHLPPGILQAVLKQKGGKGRGKKPASLHLDLMKGKMETEAPFLYGVLVEKGREIRIKVPTLETLHNLLEKGSRDRSLLEKFRKKPKALAQIISQAQAQGDK